MEQAGQVGSDLWAIIGVGIAIVGLQWRMTSMLEKRLKENVSDLEKRLKENVSDSEKRLKENVSDSEKRLTENADQAHAQIGENINRVEKGLNQRIDDLRSDVMALTDRFDRHLEHHSG